jgi:hypothetical protein
MKSEQSGKYLLSRSWISELPAAPACGAQIEYGGL